MEFDNLGVAFVLRAISKQIAQLPGSYKTSLTVSHNKKSINKVLIDISVKHIFKLSKKRFSSIARS